MLGWELNEAVAHLQENGCRVICEEVRSKKGMTGNERRVIRAQTRMDGDEACVCLCYSVFKTDIMWNGDIEGEE